MLSKREREQERERGRGYLLEHVCCATGKVVNKTTVLIQLLFNDIIYLTTPTKKIETIKAEEIRRRYTHAYSYCMLTLSEPSVLCLWHMLLMGHTAKLLTEKVVMHIIRSGKLQGFQWC